MKTKVKSPLILKRFFFNPVQATVALVSSAFGRRRIGLWPTKLLVAREKKPLVPRVGHCMVSMEPRRAFNQIVNSLRELGKALCYCISRLLISFLFTILLMDKVLSLLTCGKRPEWDTSQSQAFSCQYFSVTYLYNWVKRDSGAIEFLVQVK